MKYYLYFDGYGNLIKAIPEDELNRRYAGNPDLFREEMARRLSERSRFQTGHMVTYTFNDHKDFQDFIDSLGDEVEGFYCCRSDSRPYNF
jgi:hypothetical protein